MTKPPYAEVRAGEEVIRFHMVMKGGILSLKAVTREDIRKTHAAIFDRRSTGNGIEITL